MSFGSYVSLSRKYLKVISHSEAKMAICSWVSMQGIKRVSKNVSQPDKGQRGELWRGEKFHSENE